MLKKLMLPLLLLVVLTAIFTAPQATAVTPPPASQNSLFNTYDVIVVRAYYNNRLMLESLTAWTEPWEVNQKEGYAVIEVTAVQFENLLADGYRVEIDAELTAALHRPNAYLPGQVDGIPGYACYRTVEETYATAQTLAANYPQLATWIDVGDSWDKTAPGGSPGYDMMVLKLTNSAIPGPKPAIFIMSSVHAREYTPAELNTRFAEYLVSNYGIDPDVTWMLDYHEFHLMLQANPDGRKHAETGLSWRKNTNQNYCGATSNSRGADLNRNFSFGWGQCGNDSCSSSYQCDLTYRGPSAGSEPETQYIEAYVRANFPDQREDAPSAPAPADASGIFLDIHSYSELVLWPWGYTSTPAPNSTALQTLGRKFAFFNSYWPEQSIGLYPTDGTTDGLGYGELGLATYTFEMGTSFFQDCGSFENTIYPNNLQALLYAGKVARTPYMTPAGPDALDVTLSSGVIAPGTAVNLTATLNDTRFNNQNGTEPTQAVAAAEYYIDTPPWITTTTPIAYPMTAVDGTFNQTVEAATAIVDTTGLSQGRHMLFVRGQDAAGNWGPVSAAFLTIIDPAIAPTISGQVLAADTGLPLEATISAGSINSVTSDPVTGMYSMQVLSGTYTLTAVPTSPLYASATIPNVTAQNYQSVTQNFYLSPYYTIFSDDVESGVNGWTAQSPWAITSEAAHSPTHSWTDSPGGSYGNYRNVSLTSPIIDFSGYSNVLLTYWQICDTEAGYDYCYVEISDNGGSTWETIASFDGPHIGWEEISLPVPQLDDVVNGRIRFRFYSDSSIVDDGWHVDDITLSGSIALFAPVANFSSTSPDALGEPTQFTNTSIGTNNSYQWDFGDDSEVVTVTNPSHVFAAPGSYTVTLTATNSLAIDTFIDTIRILQPPLASFTTLTQTVSLGETAVFTNTSAGDELNYQWDFGDGSRIVTTANAEHVYETIGTFTVTLTVTSPVGTSVATDQITVTEQPLHAIYLPAIWKE